MLGDSAYDTMLARPPAGRRVVPVAPYNARNTDDPKDIEYRVEARIDEHSEDVQLKQSTLDETYNRRSGVERTNDAVKDCARSGSHSRRRSRRRCRRDEWKSEIGRENRDRAVALERLQVAVLLPLRHLGEVLAELLGLRLGELLGGVRAERVLEDLVSLQLLDGGAEVRR